MANGSFGISSNLAYPISACPGYAVVDSGLSDATIQVSLPANLQDTRIPFRFTDADNSYWIENMGGSPPSYGVIKRIGGTSSLLGRISIPAANGDSLKIILSGSTIKIYVNDVVATQVNDSSLNGTKHGIGLWCGSSIRYDNFSVSTNAPSATPTPLTTFVDTNTSFDMKVLVLKYFPLTSDGQRIDINVTGDVGGLYSAVRQKTIDNTTFLANNLQRSSSYLGYSNPQAQPSLRYSIVDTKEYTQAVPFNPQNRRPLYTQILNNANICDYVNNQGVNEVWMWAYQGPQYPGSQFPYLNISESKMSGPFGDISNSYRGNDMPLCSHTYRLYTFTYDGTSAALHSWGHQIEAEMNAIDGNLWGIFQGSDNGRNANQTTRCGSVHYPPNAQGGYDYGNSSSWNSDCLNWSPDTLGNLSQISCSNWGCADNGPLDHPQLHYLIWMFQNIPGANNTKSYNGRQLKNWWDVHGDFDNVMGSSRRLTL